MKLIMEGKKGQALNMIFSKYDQAQVQDSINLAMDLITEEAALLDGKLDKIIIGGFSQGAMISMGTLLRLSSKFDKPLGGCIGLSGIVPCTPVHGQQLGDTLPELTD